MRTLRLPARVLAVLVGLTLLVPASWAGTHETNKTASSNPIDSMYDRPAPDYDLNLATAAPASRRANEAQTAALATLQGQAPGVKARWNDFGGSPDVVMDFASPTYPGTPEDAGRAFLADNAALFSIGDVASLKLVRDTPALGGHLLRFQQTFGGVDVKDGGVGL